MNVLPLKPLGCLAVMMAWAVSANAQSTIQFSVPAGPDKVDQSSGLAEPAHSKKLSVSDYNAPISVFGQSDPAHAFDRLPAPPPYENAANTKKWKKFLDGQKNWALTTPKEIMGLQTPEEILGLANAKENQELSTADRYLQRQSSLANRAATNGSAGFSSLLQPNSVASLFGRQEEPQGYSKLDGSDSKEINQALKMTAKASPFSVDSSSSQGGANPFGLPAPLAKTTPDQVAAMERFRAMMDSSPPVEKPAVSTVFSSTSTASRPTFGLGGNVNPMMQVVSLENPAGHTFQPATHELAKPVGIAPLSGISRPLATPSTKSPNAPKLPPWLKDPTQPFRGF